MITPSFGLTVSERVLPKLALDFTTASLDNRITFTRATGASNPATYVNSSGVITAATNNQPRFDYDPVTLACKGLLIEESRTNALLRSNEFSTSPWAIAGTGGTPAAILSASVGTSPDGTNNAWKLIAGTGAGTHYIQQTVGAYTSGTFSLYAKAAEKSVVRLAMFNSGTVASFDLAAETSSGSGTRTITPVGGGWYRCTVYNSGTSNTLLQIYTGDNNAGNGTDGVLIYGAQFENAGAFATSYIPTTTTALTRNADVATMTGTNFSDWFNASEGTFECVVEQTPSTISTSLFNVNDGGTNNRIVISRDGGGTNTAIVSVGGVSQAAMQKANTAQGSVNNHCFTYKANSFAYSRNGDVAATDTSGSIPAGLTQMMIGRGPTGGLINSHISAIRYWPQNFTTVEVQAFSK